MKRTDAFTSIRTEGGLLPADLLVRVAAFDKDLAGITPTGYHLADGERINDAINRSWNRLVGAWAGFSESLARIPADDRTATNITRSRWSLVLFQELGYGQLQTTKAAEIDGKTYAVSHGWGQVPVHLVGARVDLDKKTLGVPGASTMSPHGLVQEYLNRSDDHLWGFVSNGLLLRLLRDNATLTRQAFVEFDLEAIFEGNEYPAFAILWLFCHQSRLEGEAASSCLLEQWSAEAAKQGTRALDQLRGGVETAIAALGSGFLLHPDNAALRDALRQGQLDKRSYYRQLLRLVYRLLFLFVAEDRDQLLQAENEDNKTCRERYIRFYSLDRIRDLASRRRGGPHNDLWAQLNVTFAALGNAAGSPDLALPGLGSFLWGDKACVDLGGSCISNRYLLAAVRALTTVNDGRVSRSVDYRNLGSEELGSIYESLLELHPQLSVETRTFALSTATGNDRKTTGSYYTPTSLIKCLLDESLEPLLDDAMRSPNPELAILQLKILDPACGSGHFLIAAAHRMARRLASARGGDTEPSPPAVRTALREVIAKCLHGIDVNEMAVELCKVSLWMEAMEPGKPLTFLDHRIVCGNALLGATPALLARGVPDEAFKPVADDDRAWASSLKRRNAQARSGQGQLFGHASADSFVDFVIEAENIESIIDDSVESVRTKEARWIHLTNSDSYRSAVHAADTWTVAFLAPKYPHSPAVTQREFETATSHPERVEAAVREHVDAISRERAVLHPHLSFLDVFKERSSGGNDNVDEAGWAGGFDLVLGNPPWDTLSPDRREFFGHYHPGLRSLSPTEQSVVVDALLEDATIKAAWEKYCRDLLSDVHFFKDSGRYRLFAPGNLGKGDFNVYRMFVESALLLTKPGGYTTQVVPGGLYGGANASAIRQELLDNHRLDVLLGLINTRRGWFAEVDIDRFCAYVSRRQPPTTQFRVLFGLEDAAQLQAALRSLPVALDAEVIRLRSPETYAIPDVRSASDIATVDKLFGSWSPFGVVQAGTPRRHYQRELDMGNDRDLFTTDPVGLPVYEGRMINLYDHRAKVYVSGHGNSSQWDAVEFGDLRKAIVPQWRVLQGDVPQKLGDRTSRFRIGFGDVANPRNERSLVAALIPPGTICGDKVPTLDFGPDEDWRYLLWLAVANSFVMDSLARRRLTSPKMSFTLLDSLPFPKLPVSDERVQWLAPHVLDLVCTAPELADFWNRMCSHGWGETLAVGAVPPGSLDPAARAAVMARIDAFVARVLFDLSLDDLAGMLDTFGVLERRERRTYGAFRTKDLVLEAFRLGDW